MAAYLGEQADGDKAAAVVRDVLRRRGPAPAHHNLCAVGEALVGGVPSPLLQRSGRLDPVAIAVVAGRECPNLGTVNQAPK